MVTDTSREAYEKIIASGLINEREAEVLDIITQHAPISSNECFHIMKDRRVCKDKFACKSDVRARFTDLKDKGVIKIFGEKLDPETNMQAKVWVLTGNMPHEKPKNKSQFKIDQAVTQERQACAAIAFSTKDTVGRSIGQKILARQGGKV